MRKSVWASQSYHFNCEITRNKKSASWSNAKKNTRNIYTHFSHVFVLQTCFMAFLRVVCSRFMDDPFFFKFLKLTSVKNNIHSLSLRDKLFVDHTHCVEKFDEHNFQPRLTQSCIFWLRCFSNLCFLFFVIGKSFEWSPVSVQEILAYRVSFFFKSFANDFQIWEFVSKLEMLRRKNLRSFDVCFLACRESDQRLKKTRSEYNRVSLKKTEDRVAYL